MPHTAEGWAVMVAMEVVFDVVVLGLALAVAYGQPWLPALAFAWAAGGGARLTYAFGRWRAGP